MFTRDPATKEELLDRMLRFDFQGDVRQLGAEPASITRLGPNRLQLSFPRSGKVYELEVHRPRERTVEGAQTKDRPDENRSWTA